MYGLAEMEGWKGDGLDPISKIEDTGITKNHGIIFKIQNEDSQSFISTRTGTSVGESVYASTILALENERKKSTDLNDQQWIFNRKKIGLSRKSKKTLDAKLDNEKSKLSTLVFIQTHFNRKECVHYVKTENIRIKRDECFCGLEKHEHHPDIEHKFIDMKSRAPRESIIEEEDEEDEDEDDQNEDKDEEPSRSGSTSSLELLLSSVDKKITWRGSRVGVDKEKEKKRDGSGIHLKVETKKNGGKESEERRKQKGVIVHWKQNSAIKEFPTNAFGVIHFEGSNSKPSSYIRLADNTTMQSVMELMKEHWDMLKPRPHLALSIVGGAKNFKMDGRLKETFKRGLISAARSTHAWVLSGGTNTGAMKLVGEAVTEGQFLVPQGAGLTMGLKALGIASWGYIANKETLINKKDSEMNRAQYNSNLEIKSGSKPPLSPDYTHFLLVDDGYRNRYIGGEGGGGIQEFITRFERNLMEPAPKGLGVPVITLMVEGGSDALNEVRDNLACGQPLVIIDGSGRSADILAYAYKNAVMNKVTGTYTIKRGHIKHLEDMLEEAFADRLSGPTGKIRKKTFMSWIMECLSYSDLITTFDIQREENLDTKILSALLKGNLDTVHQLYLAMVWNRVDIAENKIFKNRTFQFVEESLDDVLTQALLMDRVGFIEVLILNGFSLYRFLTVKKLRILYNEGAAQHKYLISQIEKFVGNCPYIHLRTIHKYLIYVMKAHHHPQYQLDKHSPKGTKDEDNDEKTFEDPYLELFIWSVLCNKPSFHDFFWVRCSSPLLAAVVAASIYSTLLKLYSAQLIKISKIKDMKANFVAKANAIAEIAFEEDRVKGVSLMYTRYPRFGERSLINLAYIGHLRGFIANPVCQEYVDQAWRRGMRKMNPWLSTIAMFFPLLIFSSNFQFLKLGDDGGNLSPWQKLFVFYRTPMVKYIGHCVSYAVFLLLYTYVAMFDFEWRYQNTELVLYMWFLILILDEFRELIIQPSSSFSRKLRDHMTSVWNKFDVFLYVTALMSLLLKNFAASFYISRILFATNSAALYLRLFRVYHANWSLGPKLVVFHKMLPEIVIFMFLLFIFILGYGTASQSLINSNIEFSTESIPRILNGIIYLPYWQMYGELNLDQIEVENRTICYEEEFCEHMEYYNHVTPVFLAIYLIAANVMLLNLLIAIFTSVFEEVQENAKDVWKWEMYRLVEEYDQKPGLAPPLVILEDIWKMLKGIWKVTCRRTKEDLEGYMQNTLETLDMFEKDCLFKHIKNIGEQEENKLDTKLRYVESKVDRMLEILEFTPTTSQWDFGDEVQTADIWDIQGSDSSEEEALKYDGFIGGRKKEKKKKVLAPGPAGAAGATAGGKRNVKFGTDSRKEFEKDEPVTQVYSARESKNLNIEPSADQLSSPDPTPRNPDLDSRMDKIENQIQSLHRDSSESLERMERLENLLRVLVQKNV